MDDFYIDDILFNNGSECSINYRVIVDVHLKGIMLEGQYRPVNWCMGTGVVAKHKYDVVDRFRDKYLRSTGVCEDCLYKLLEGLR